MTVNFAALMLGTMERESVLSGLKQSHYMEEVGKLALEFVRLEANV